MKLLYALNSMQPFGSQLLAFGSVTIFWTKKSPINNLLQCFFRYSSSFLCIANRVQLCLHKNHRNVGLLTVEETPAKDLREVEDSLRHAGESCEILTSKDLKERYPNLRFPSNYIGLLEHSAGILKADQCLRVLQVANKIAPW